MPLCFIIYRMLRPGLPAKSTLTLRIPPALATSSNSSNIPPMIVSSPSGRISTVFKGLEGRGQRQGPKGRKHLLYCLVETSASAEQRAFEQTDAFTSSRDRVTRPTNPACGPVAVVAVVAALGLNLGGGEGLDSARKSMLPAGQTCRWRSAWQMTPRAPMGSSISDHDEIQTPDRYMPHANASEAEPQKHTMGNDPVESC